MSLLQTIVAFVVALGVLIVVHEYGHYLAARLCNVRVLRFSVGFGRPVLTRRFGRDRTEWVVAAIPFGGYVKMLDEREADVAAHERARAFNRQSVGRRFVIVVAGPVFNFLFAILVYCGLFMYGVPESRPVVAAPAQGTPAAQAGFEAGQTVRAIDGEPVTTWQEFRWRVIQGALQRESLRVEVIDAARHLTELRLDLRAISAEAMEGDVLAHLGVRVFRPPLAAELGQVVPGGAAALAGLREGDLVRSVDGRMLDNWEALVRVVRASPGARLEFEIVRDGRSQRVSVTPDEVVSGDVRIGRIGAAPRIPEGFGRELMIRVSHGPLQALSRAVEKTYDISVFSLRMLGKMVIGEVSWKNLSGPVTIADFAGQSAQAGWISYLTFLALISISLGVLNLLPIPLLDGGHLMYYFFEFLKGSPVSDRAMELGQRVGLALLLVMMVFALYNDINRLVAG